MYNKQVMAPDLRAHSVNGEDRQLSEDKRDRR